MELTELFSFGKEQRQKLRQNYQILKQEVDKIGKQYEQKSYEEILHSGAEGVMINSVENPKISCYVEALNLQKDGTIEVSIDADGLPTMFGIKPSYHFYKKRDGLVFY